MKQKAKQSKTKKKKEIETHDIPEYISKKDSERNNL
jgi:hypothetical protein